MMQILMLSLVAGVVLARLVSVLGKRTGAEPPPKPQPVQGPAAPELRNPLHAQPAREAVPAMFQDLVRVDPAFDPEKFLSGARHAYEMIVVAFSKGDKSVLQRLLTPAVFAAYAAAIDARGAEPGPELVRLKGAKVVECELEGSAARIDVRFEAELAEGAVGVRETREIWTFERHLRSKDPTWLLLAVAQG